MGNKKKSSTRLRSHRKRRRQQLKNNIYSRTNISSTSICKLVSIKPSTSANTLGKEISTDSSQEQIDIEFAESDNQHRTRPDSKVFITGRRIVDINYFTKSLMAFKHMPFFNCEMTSIHIVDENRIGFMSCLTYQCSECNAKLDVFTENPELGQFDINIAATHGIISTGCGFIQLKEISSILNIPPISKRLYQQCQNKLGQVYTEEANKSMIQAGKEEHTIALNDKQIDVKGIPKITVIADGAWSKRSYRTNYNAPSGVASIIGLRTSKILFSGVKNKYCHICDRSGGNIKPHQCFKNWTEPSTAMEAAIILEGFQKSIFQHNLIYDKLIADGDSSVYRKITQAKPYGPTTLIKKIECTNHLLRNFCTKLRELGSRRLSCTGKVVPPHVRRVINKNTLRLRNAAVSAAKYRARELGELNAVENLRRDLENSPSHVFGEHKDCMNIKYFTCTPNDKEINWVEEMTACGVYEDILKLIRRLCVNADSLIRLKSNTIVEVYNSIVAKYTGGKRINYSRRNSFQIRTQAAVLSFNEKCEYHKLIFNTIAPQQEIGEYVEKLIEEKRASDQKKKNQIRRKKTTNKSISPDQDYGPEAADPTINDMSFEVYEQKEAEFLESLKLNKESISKLESETRGQSSSHVWKTERLSRITASNMGKICKLKPTTNPAKTIRALLYSNFKGTNAVLFGKEHERKAIQDFENIYKLKVEPCGFFVHPELFYLGASPDGYIVQKDAIVEVKCLFKCRDFTPLKAIELGKVPFAKLVSKNLKLKNTHNYYYQIQAQLNIANKEECYFILWTPKGILVEIIKRDQTFWTQDMVPKLETFYFKYLLKELVDPRVPRGAPLRTECNWSIE